MRSIKLLIASMIMLYSSSANAFKFDVWESGMDAEDIINTAKRNNIKLSGGETVYFYRDKILGKEAEVSLRLTRGDYKLMELSVNWFNGVRELMPVLKKIIEDKNPISKKWHPEYMFIAGQKYSYMLDKENSVDIESKITQLIEMKYQNIILFKINEKRKAWDEKEAQRKTVARDINKFSPDISQEQEKEVEIYRWTDENGVTHFSNIEEGENSSVVKTKPIGKVQLKEPLWCNVFLKNGNRIKAKKVDRISENKMAIIDGAITTEIPINEISKIEEASNVGGKIQTELRSPKSF